MTTEVNLTEGSPFPGGSVFLRALGDEAANLHPAVLRYVSGSGVIGEAVSLDGVFEVAGSRLSLLNWLARPVVGPGLLVTAFERGVAFRVENRPGWEPRSAGRGAVEEAGSVGPAREEVKGRATRAGTGELGLHAERVFKFRRGEQRFVDVLLAGDAPGTLRNLLGERRRVELELHCSATDSGRLRLESGRAWLRFGRLRLRLPHLFSVHAVVEDGYEETTGRNTVDARVRSPLLGTILEYRGSFRQSTGG
ncbi:uncharacterized protein DUF4166 [Leucobacter komagatae]|uniref:Uncharacterized protein DUF4166 n=1 Tax=Leucobacter komagatae TaxID=55969 RepID=A0A542Y576_9MICO|nr:DUF4166 domain-containing protein [Leucobacter komagatae]TQL43223.1 uncharacterized protein DUF4166 [Leucobacter komagatae]